MTLGRRPGSYIVLSHLGAAEHLLISGPALEGERVLSSSEAMAAIRRATGTHAASMAQVMRLVGAGVGFGAVQRRTASEQQRIVEAAIRRGQLIVVQRTHKVSPFSHDDLPDTDPGPDLQPLEPEPPPAKRRLRRVELGNLFYWPSQIAVLPTDKLDRSPWAALVTAARHMERHPGDTPVLAFHQTADEPKETSERRALAMRAFIRDDRDAWVGLEAQHGSIADTQNVLAYLAKTKAWPTEVVVSGKANEQTETAVAAFQQHRLQRVDLRRRRRWRPNSRRDVHRAQG